mmetsp:Transcript_31963/g.56451  ORF Transcript_31963/g.56451 Transcript_31963/m.56451 type:complete len:261 (+) Transcript_31963:73-855(+)
MAIDQSSAVPEQEFTEAQLADASLLMEEMPRIEAALKSYLSMRMAEGLTTGSEADKGTSGAKSAAASAAALQGCARVVLKTLNALDLPPAPQWGLRHPQGEEESAVEYMTRLGKYKVVQALWSRCRAADQKPAKLLGRSSMQIAFPEVSAQILADLPGCAASARATEEQLREFITGFAATLVDDSSAMATDDGPSDAELVWSTNMAASLAARQEARKSQAAERVQRATTADDFSSQLRAALGGEAQPAETPGVQIEEVHD